MIVDADEDEDSPMKEVNLEKTFECINAVDFFAKFADLRMSEDLRDSIISVAGKNLPQSSKRFFIYKDLEVILEAYGFTD